MLIPSRRTFPPEPVCFGTRPTYAANSRPDLNADASPIVATAAVAISGTTPGPVLAADGAGKVELSDLHFATTGNGLQQLEGTGTNVSNKPVKSVFVKFNLLQNGAVVGNIGANPQGRSRCACRVKENIRQQSGKLMRERIENS